MKTENFITFVMAIVGSAMIGAHFDSLLVGIGTYLCVAAAGNWN